MGIPFVPIVATSIATSIASGELKSLSSWEARVQNQGTKIQKYREAMPALITAITDNRITPEKVLEILKNIDDDIEFTESDIKESTILRPSFKNTGKDQQISTTIWRAREQLEDARFQATRALILGTQLATPEQNAMFLKAVEERRRKK